MGKNDLVTMLSSIWKEERVFADWYEDWLDELEKEKSE